ncbi:IS66 family insertion sequence element accessory protein TnpB [Pseudomonas fildesensis]
MKVLVHEGIGVWLAARRLNQGKFQCPGIRQPYGLWTTSLKFPTLGR